MTRTDSNWIGGINYLANLLASVASLPERRIETVLLVPPNADVDIATRFPADEIIRTRLVHPRGWRRLTGVASERLFGRNLAIEWLARRHRIDVMSHAMPAGDRSPVRTIAWIPDFQHMHLPDLFSTKDRAVRDRAHRTIVRAARIVLLSSRDAQRDLARIRPEAESKSRVLQFVSGLDHGKAARPFEAIATEYGLDGLYFHLPNQMWRHKNHRIVIAALGLLRREGLTPAVVSTGHTEDFRYPGFLDEVMAQIHAEGVEKNFRILGLIPYADATALMRHAAAIINPSLFEGWSTTVEEAKSTGKRILLSDIGVHREQAPSRAIFFPPDDPVALADAMKTVIAMWSSTEESAHIRAAADALPDRVRAFGDAYQAIVLEAAGRQEH